MLLQHLPNEQITIKTKQPETPFVQCTLQTQQGNIVINVELGELQNEESVSAAMARRILETDFNIYALYIDLSKAWMQKTLYIGGNIQVNHNIWSMRADVNLFVADPRRYTRAINASLRYDLPFHSYLDGLIEEQARSFTTHRTLRGFLDIRNPMAAAHALEMSNAMEDILQYVDITRVITTYNSKGILPAITTLHPAHINSTLAHLPAFYSKNNEIGHAFLARKQWVTVIAFCFAHYAAIVKYSGNQNVPAEHYQGRLEHAFQNCPFKNFIACVAPEYQVNFTYIRNKYLGIADPSVRIDEPFIKMIEKVDSYHYELYLKRISQQQSPPPMFYVNQPQAMFFNPPPPMQAAMPGLMTPTMYAPGQSDGGQ
jgi:hypothetical protein